MGAGAVGAAALPGQPDDPGCLSSGWATSWCSSRFCWTRPTGWAFMPTATTCASNLQTGQAGQVLFPGGKFIGEDQYANLIATRFNMTVPEFEDDVKNDIVIRRLQAYITGRRDGGRPGCPRRLPQGQHQDQVRLRGDFGGRHSQGHQTLPIVILRRSSTRTRRAMRRRFRKSAKSLLRVYAERPAGRHSAADAGGDSGVLYAHKADYQTPEQGRGHGTF